MCGIAAIYNPSKAISSNTLNAMVTSLHHRGPDAQGLIIEQNGQVGLGNTRLSLVDLNKRSNMPMSIDNILLTFNGEIYNFRDIRYELEKEGYVFTTTSDSEVIIKSYLKWGIDCLSHFNGCFAFILFDKRQNKLFIARDQFGEKPLLYTKAQNGDWLFASEVKALLCHPFVKKRINMDSVINLITFIAYGDHDMTFFNNITFLPAGHFILFDLKNPRDEPKPIKYSKLDEIKPKDYSEKDLPDLIQTYKKLFTNSLTLKLGADLPLGAILSGGLDSSYITALASQKQYKMRQTDLACFSIKYFRHRNIDFEFAQELSQSLSHTSIYEVTVNPHPEMEEFKKLTQILDRPVLDMTQKSMYQNYLAVKNFSLKSVLNGEGNDELWLGYYLATDFYRFPPGDYSEKNFGKFWYENSLFTKYLTKGMKERTKSIIQENLRKNFTPYDSEDKINKVMWFSIKTHLQSIFIEEDLLSMANSIELRLPYIDLELFKFALSVPSKLKVWDKKEKYIVRKAAQDSLPSGILKRRKLGFPFPSKVYFNNYILSEDVKKLKKSDIISQLFPMDSFDKIWKKLTPDQKYALFSLELFEKTHF